jgi:hypothetical protein
MAEIAISMYIGMCCHYCGTFFDTRESLNDAVRDHDRNGKFALAHKGCFRDQES